VSGMVTVATSFRGSPLSRNAITSAQAGTLGVRENRHVREDAVLVNHYKDLCVAFNRTWTWSPVLLHILELGITQEGPSPGS
jgi:hypothetical protein